MEKKKGKAIFFPKPLELKKQKDKKRRISTAEYL
jgi:hypothetical protein